MLPKWLFFHLAGRWQFFLWEVNNSTLGDIQKQQKIKNSQETDRIHSFTIDCGKACDKAKLQNVLEKSKKKR